MRRFIMGMVLGGLLAVTAVGAQIISPTAPVPTGAIVLIDAGNCPSGFIEVAALDGRMLRGTLQANADVGTTGGADAVVPTGIVSQPSLTMDAYTPGGTNGTVAFTPAGTNGWPVGVPTFAGTAGTVPAETITWPVGVPTFTGNALGTHTHTFTGSALATHQHELPFQIVSATSMRMIAASTFGTGTSRAAIGAWAPASNTTSAAVAKAQAVSAGTPAGTNALVSAGTPSGTNAWPVGVPTNSTVNFTPVGTITWPAGVPSFTGSSGTVPAEVFTGTPASLTGSISQPTFLGTALDNRPAFARVIFCKKS